MNNPDEPQRFALALRPQLETPAQLLFQTAPLEAREEILNTEIVRYDEGGVTTLSLDTIRDIYKGDKKPGYRSEVITGLNDGNLIGVANGFVNQQLEGKRRSIEDAINQIQEEVRAEHVEETDTVLEDVIDEIGDRLTNPDEDVTSLLAYLDGGISQDALSHVLRNRPDVSELLYRFSPGFTNDSLRQALSAAIREEGDTDDFYDQETLDDLGIDGV